MERKSGGQMIKADSFDISDNELNGKHFTLKTPDILSSAGENNG